MPFGHAYFPCPRPASAGRPAAFPALAVLLVGALLRVAPAAAVTVEFPGPRGTVLPRTGLSVQGVRLAGETADNLLVGLTDGSLALIRYTTVSGSFELRQRLFLEGRLVGLLPWEGLPVSQRGFVAAAADPDRIWFVRVNDSFPFLVAETSVDLDEDPASMAWFGNPGAGLGRLAVALPGADAVAVLAADGGWHTAQSLAVGDEPASLAAADLDGDDTPEIVVAERGVLSGDLAVLTIDAGGTVSARFTRVAGLEAGLVAACGHDDAGRARLAIADRERASVCFVRADGDGFAVEDSLVLTIPAGHLLHWPLADGSPALLVGSAERGAAEFVSLVDGAWIRHETYYPGCRPVACAIADINGDGQPDIATAAYGQSLLTVMTGRPGPAFSGLPSLALSTEPADLALGDFDGDGRSDVLVPAAFEPRASVFAGRDGGFRTEARDHPLAFVPGQVAAVALDADPVSELVALDPVAGQVVVLDDDGAGGLVETQRRNVGPYPSTLETGDIDADGRVDLLVLDADRTRILLLFGEADGTFGEAVAVTYEIDTTRAIMPDLDGDGRLDLVGLDGSSRLWWRLNLGERQFGPGQWAHAGLGTASLAAGDVDGDHDLDVVVGCRVDQSLVPFQNDGAGGLVRRSGSYALGSEPSGVRIADFDRDGRGDVVVALRSQDRLDIYLGIVPWNHQFAMTVPSTPDLLEFDVTDVNVDGSADLLVLDSTLRLGVAHLNIDPTAVAVEPRALEVACAEDGGLEARLAPAAGLAWRLEGRVDADWRLLAEPAGAAVGRLEPEAGRWRYVLAAGDLDRWGRPAELKLSAGAGSVPELEVRETVVGSCGAAGATMAGRAAWIDGPWPNPANPSVRATFRLARREAVRVGIYDLAGRCVAQLVDGELAAGDHEVRWDGNSHGAAAPAGTYLLRLQTPGGLDGRKIVLLK